MTSPYLDAGFLITLVIETGGTKLARETLHQVEAPCKLTRLHEFQLQTLLQQIRFSEGKANDRTVEQAAVLWRWYLDEGVLEIVDLDWNRALANAATFVQQQSSAAPPPLLILHPILAAYSGASRFLSFDPRSRGIARALGLKVLPEII